MRILKASSIFILCLTVLGCATSSSDKWESKVDGQHPLVGEIWDVKGKKFISRGDLESELAANKYVLLGEKHDNPDHHRLQAELVRELGAKNKSAIVGFEQLDVSQSKALKSHFDVNPWSARGIGAAVNWKKSGWPDWRMYEPIAQAALDNKMQIVPLNLSKSLAQKVASRGLAVLDDNLYRQLQLGKPIPRKLRLPLVEELRASHCYMVPDRGVDRLVRVQRARDAFMAYETYNRGMAKGAILIVGAGHARKEWGIPKYIAQLEPHATIASVAFMEVKRDYDRAELYVDSQLPYDYIWFTPRLENVDPCKKFRDQLKKMKHDQRMQKKLKKIQKSHKKS